MVVRVGLYHQGCGSQVGSITRGVVVRWVSITRGVVVRMGLYHQGCGSQVGFYQQGCGSQGRFVSPGVW